MKPLRFALVGTGNIARTYAAAVAKVPEAEIAAVVSRRQERAEAFIRERGLAAKAAERLDAVAAEVEAVILAIYRAAREGRRVPVEP